MTESNACRPVVLCVLDGWGQRDEPADNAIARARTPVYDRLLTTCPHTLLRTSGTDVGLPENQMGNSEVGHLNLGAGRIVNQEIRRIDASIEDGSLAGNPALREFISSLAANGGVCHLLGLISPGGVHSHQDHIAELARLLDGAGIPVAVHCFLDGRDTPPASALGYVETFLDRVKSLSHLRIATVMGRYYAMDRDNRWDRNELAYQAMVAGDGARAADPLAAIRESYDKDLTDEFMLPAVIDGFTGMSDGDGVLVANFRADRVRQILSALVDPGFEGFERPRVIRFTSALGMVEYSGELNALHKVLFPAQRLDRILGSEIANAGLRQLRIAETEKYAHVTFFFNGGVETPLPGEERVLIPSPKVATYDLAPEMSAREVTDRLVSAVGSGDFDFILVNYANPDMVGHTGILDAATIAIETVDQCLGRLEEAVRSAGGVLLITADHGNAETMRDPDTGAPHTAHTLNPVPAILVNAPPAVRGLAEGSLADVAPTLLGLLDLAQPVEMTGHSLLEPTSPAAAGADDRVSV